VSGILPDVTPGGQDALPQAADELRRRKHHRPLALTVPLAIANQTLGSILSAFKVDYTLAFMRF
jgi:hypothetical protein